ncbi:hypothetical protein PWY87_07755 [Kribbella solani]|uniref:hypothetical protein n=1 Tax=Kribbella solani TaxID=236067 RepID=UPI0029A1B02C|nr:hypothetical protein [Kribbella solani]MDX3001555.1 hypothetical protein [Kribbella solani]
MGERQYPSVVRDREWVDGAGVRWWMRGGEVQGKRVARLGRDLGVRVLHVYLDDVREVPSAERGGLLERVGVFERGKADDFVEFRVAEFRNAAGQKLLVVEETC